MKTFEVEKKPLYSENEFYENKNTKKIEREKKRRVTFASIP